MAVNFSNLSSNVGVCDPVKRPDSLFSNTVTDSRRQTSLFDTTQTDSRRIYAKTLCDEFCGQYSTYQDRMATFYQWPKCLQGAKPTDLVVAGFYYTGTGDIVRCFSCNILLKDWEPSNSAVNEHLKWSPKCNFIKFITDKKEQLPRVGIQNF